MSTEQPIPIERYCQHEQVDIAFVHALHDRGLIHLVAVSEQRCILPEELPTLERLARLHLELDINLEGLEAITHLLERMERLQEEVRGLRERLRLYEGDEPVA